MNIFFSPHADDVCFSLGATISELKSRGILITVFSQSVFRTLSSNSNLGREDAEIVTAVRVAEDLRFAQLLGLEYETLGYHEPRLRDRKPFGDRDHKIEAQLCSQLLPSIQRFLIRGNAELNLWFPLGVGEHIDHIAISIAALKNLEVLRDHATVKFYVDLPYAAMQCNSESLSVRAGLMQSLGAELHVTELSPSKLKEKRDQVLLYSSQHGVFPSHLIHHAESYWTLPRAS